MHPLDLVTSQPDYVMGLVKCNKNLQSQVSNLAFTPYFPPKNIHYTITNLTMSLLRTLPTRALPLLRTRPFSTSPYVSRSVVEGTKDVIDAANRSVGKGLKKGIETGGESIH